MRNLRRLFVVAAEPSADTLCARLIQRIKSSSRPFSLHGVFGPHTASAAGLAECDSLFPPADLAVMGFGELLPALPRLIRRVRRLRSSVREVVPDTVVFVDNKGISNRVAPYVPHGTPLVQYVAPSVWAWKGGEKQVPQTAALFDHLLLLFPFEYSHWKNAGVQATVVGSPVVESILAGHEQNIHLDVALGKRDPSALRPGDRLELAVLLGSRTNEVERHGPIVGGILDQLQAESRGRIRRVVLPVASAALGPLVESAAASWGLPFELDFGPARIALARADAGVVVSGTAALEAAAYGCPHVVIYRASRLTEAVAKSRARVKFVGLPNLLAGDEVVPEFVFDRCTPQAVGGALEPLLDSSPMHRIHACQSAWSGIEGLLHDAKASPPSCVASDVVASYLFRDVASA